MKKLINQMFKNEVISYIFWGATTTAVSIVMYTFLGYFLDYKIANLISIIVSKLYGYFVNKLFVFKSSCSSLHAFLKELITYILSRAFTGLVDFFGVVFFVEVCLAGPNLAKYVTMAIVIVLNYFFGKNAVFVHRKGENDGV